MITKPELSGSLMFLNLGELLQVLGSNGSTGVLRLRSKYAPVDAEIHLQDGNPVNALNGQLEGVDALNALFGWIDAEFAFSSMPITGVHRIDKSRMNIILDAMRLLDEGKIEKLGPFSFSKKSSGLRCIKGPLINYLYIVDEDEFAAGQQVIVEGVHGKWIWVVIEGTVEISKQTDQGPVPIVQLGGGAFLGSVAAFGFNSPPRGANVVAVNDVQLGVLDFQKLAHDFSLCSPQYRQLVYSMDKRLRQATDFAARLYWNDNPVSRLIANRIPFSAEAGEDKVAIIKKGSALVVRQTDRGRVPLAILETDDYLYYGNMLDIGGEPTSSELYVSDDFEVTYRDLAPFQAEHHDMAGTLRNMIEHVAICVSTTAGLADDYYKRAAQSAKTSS